MAKIQIKSEKLTPFGGFFRVMEQFDSTLSSVIDSTLGLRCTSYIISYPTLHPTLHPTLKTQKPADITAGRLHFYKPNLKSYLSFEIIKLQFKPKYKLLP